MEIYLIRHTTPQIKKGTCYGQSDLDVTETFHHEAASIRAHVPSQVEEVYSSPLKRCRQLAEYLFPAQAIQFEDRLKEIHCGEWEMRLWDEINSKHLQAWMADSINVPTPGGESYQDLYDRVASWFSTVTPKKTVAIVAHGGVLRSLLSHVHAVPLKDSFDQYKLRYGCVVKVVKEMTTFEHTILHNPWTVEEQHRPSEA